MKMDRNTESSAPALALQGLRGFCMGVADIVPGVSGGTIALILGIYQRLVDNIRSGAGVLGRLVRLDPKGAAAQLKAIEWAFIIPLLVGIGTAFLGLSHLIEQLLKDYPEEMAGLFLGLVVASTMITWKLVEDWNVETFALVGGVSVSAFVLLGFQSGAISNPTVWQWFGAGAIAICAMILPGISGSFLLLMMGMYAALLSSVNDRELGDVAIFLIGAIIGLALFSTLLSWLLEYHSDRVLAALIGLMIGSVRVLWPWPNGVGIISDDEAEVVTGTDLGWPTDFTDFLWPTVLAVVAFVFVAGVSAYADHRAS